ncbi:uncharacterized protein YegL [Hymenobacter luteus]|uniref:Uncharacterized protein YegL n=2 Tax=Hymenobacter TaxID=89966 RepID=A0A7W9WBX4_9BACT|nr:MULTISPECIES: vWA domain-containing protein [Hymenobacter]MBB4600913.1 uncharacterized protein YegL [Hymenobacter latericoloratus]MBB6058880.1 uncharacterized protein YegL [Hymenobacter luteus]
MFEQPPVIGKVSVPRNFHQLGVLILDGSGSMGNLGNGNLTKADEVNIAVRDLLTRFKISRVKNNFSFAVVTFDTQAKLHTPVTSAGTVDDNEDYNPLPGHGGGTNIGAALQEGWRVAESFIKSAPADGVKHSAVLLIMSDGECQYAQQTLQLVEQLKSNPQITISAALLNKLGENDVAGRQILRSVVTNPVLDFKDVYDAETLRSFFEKSMSRASGGITIG